MKRIKGEKRTERMKQRDTYTLFKVHFPLQCTPSPLLGPITTLLKVAPSSRMNTASASPPSDCSLQVEGDRSHWYMPPSSEPPAATVLTAARAVMPEGVGKVVWSSVLVVAAEAVAAARARRERVFMLMVDMVMVLVGGGGGGDVSVCVVGWCLTGESIGELEACKSVNSSRC